MTYQPVRIPTGIDPTLERVVRDAVDPLLRDAHSMLRLPLADPGLDGGCNFSMALALLGVVSGVSVTLYDDATIAGVDKRNQGGEAFKRLLKYHYPWNKEQIQSEALRAQNAAILYKAFRNPLSHNLGYEDKYGTRKVAKGPLSDEEITSIEQSVERPPELNPTLTSGSTKSVLNVVAFYWGVRKMIWRVLEANTGTGAALPGPAGAVQTTAAQTRSGVTSNITSASGTPRK